MAFPLHLRCASAELSTELEINPVRSILAASCRGEPDVVASSRSRPRKGSPLLNAGDWIHGGERHDQSPEPGRIRCEALTTPH